MIIFTYFPFICLKCKNNIQIVLFGIWGIAIIYAIYWQHKTYNVKHSNEKKIIFKIAAKWKTVPCLIVIFSICFVWRFRLRRTWYQNHLIDSRCIWIWIIMIQRAFSLKISWNSNVKKRNKNIDIKDRAIKEYHLVAEISFFFQRNFGTHLPLFLLFAW